MNVKHVFISLCLLLLDCCCNLYNMIEYIYIFIQVDCKSKSFNFNSVFFFLLHNFFFCFLSKLAKQTVSDYFKHKGLSFADLGIG